VAVDAATLLSQLKRVRHAYGPEGAAAKTRLLQQFERRRLPDADAVLDLHETLCFLRAYPDDPTVLETVERLLAGFAERGDLRRFRRALADTGVAGTAIHYRFYWMTARWLARYWPGRIHIDWADFDNRERLRDLLHLLVTYSETPALDMLDFSSRQWIDTLKGPGESDAAFLIRRFAALRGDGFGRETHYEKLDVPIRLDPGPDTPSRTQAWVAPDRVVFQTRPLSRRRPRLRDEVERAPTAVRAVPPGEGRRWIDVAREAMVTRSRDLDAFAYADENDVRRVDCGNGLEFICYGAIPERRLLLESVYGFITLKNGVPIGYVLGSSLFESSEVAYNVFDTFRGAEAAAVFGRVLAMMRHLFGADAFSIDPYQLGHGNAEGLASGAWWFYYKLGFRPRDPDVRRVLRGELSRMKRNPGHRSSVATLNELSAAHVYLDLSHPGQDNLGRLAVGQVGLRISQYLAGRFGADRERGTRVCSEEAADLLGVRSMRRWSRGERLAWERWSPLVLILPGGKRWSAANRRALVRVVRAKGGRRESAYVRRFDEHRALRRAVRKLIESP
jgi:hypothetical protein